VPEYMLLLYAPEADEAERAERWAEMPLWDRVNASLEEAGVAGHDAQLARGDAEARSHHDRHLERRQPATPAGGRRLLKGVPSGRAKEYEG
jgi:hypothetical protein